MLDQVRQYRSSTSQQSSETGNASAQTQLRQAPEPVQDSSSTVPFVQKTVCDYEPILKNISHIRVLVINDLLREEGDISEVAREHWGKAAAAKLQSERDISKLALENILSNVRCMVADPVTRVAHYSEIASATEEFKPDAIVLSGSLSDFDYYNPVHLERFARFIRSTKIPVLAICGGHQLVSMSFGSRIETLDHLNPSERRINRLCEYQYRRIRILDPLDPIFVRFRDPGNRHGFFKTGGILRVWQNHGLQVEGVPHGFKLLATAYLCRNQMMVRRTGGQLIYTVQFHLEKSFEDWYKNPTRWEHHNDSRDGRTIFGTFLELALQHAVPD
jgi:GMP synthase (glutamine-hydrolysing)